MSYILDALKKSQRQRELGSVPKLTTEQLAPHRRGSGIVPWAIAAVAVAMAAILVALYGPFGHPVLEADRKAVPVAEASSSAPAAGTLQLASQGTAPVAAGDGQSAMPVLPPAAVSVDPTGGSDAIRVDAVAVPEAVAHAKAPVMDNAETSAVAGRLDAKAEIAAQNGPPAAEVQPTAASTAAVSVESSVMQPAPLLAELPYDLQRSLPALALNVHVYAQIPKERFVFLNMQKYKEGERTREGVLIEEITPEGAVLRYGQQRFRLVY